MKADCSQLHNLQKIYCLLSHSYIWMRQQISICGTGYSRNSMKHPTESWSSNQHAHSRSPDTSGYSNILHEAYPMVVQKKTNILLATRSCKILHKYIPWPLIYHYKLHCYYNRYYVYTCLHHHHWILITV